MGGFPGLTCVYLRITQASFYKGLCGSTGHQLHITFQAYKGTLLFRGNAQLLSTSPVTLSIHTLDTSTPTVCTHFSPQAIFNDLKQCSFLFSLSLLPFLFSSHLQGVFMFLPWRVLNMSPFL